MVSSLSSSAISSLPPLPRRRNRDLVVVHTSDSTFLFFQRLYRDHPHCCFPLFVCALLYTIEPHRHQLGFATSSQLALAPSMPTNFTIFPISDWVFLSTVRAIAESKWSVWYDFIIQGEISVCEEEFDRLLTLWEEGERDDIWPITSTQYEAALFVDLADGRICGMQFAPYNCSGDTYEELFWCRQDEQLVWMRYEEGEEPYSMRYDGLNDLYPIPWLERDAMRFTTRLMLQYNASVSVKAQAQWNTAHLYYRQDRKELLRYIRRPRDYVEEPVAKRRRLSYSLTFTTASPSSSSSLSAAAVFWLNGSLSNSSLLSTSSANNWEASGSSVGSLSV